MGLNYSVWGNGIGFPLADLTSKNESHWKDIGNNTVILMVPS